jgi:hypothetical protein
MAAVSNSVVHLTMRFDSTVLSIGTGLLYERNGEYFIVTAWHNVTGRHTETLSHLSKHGGVPNNILATIAVYYPEAGMVNRQSVVLPLLDEGKALFYIHPVNWPRVDVVAIPFDPKKPQICEFRASDGEVVKMEMLLMNRPEFGLSTEVFSFQNHSVPNNGVAEKWLDTVDVSEELFIPGYPLNIQDLFSQPVWKRATVASSVQHGWNKEPKFLVDTASLSGMSGSPVLYYSPNGNVQVRGTTYHFSQEVAILAGIYVGRIGITKNADPQVGIVWHQSVIDQIIDGKTYESLPEDIEVSTDVLEAVVKDSLKSCSQKGLDNINNPDMPSRFYVRQEVLRKVSGRASPDRALRAVLGVAETYDGPLVPDEDNHS